MITRWNAGREGRATVWLLIGITLLAAALRVYRIGASGLWTDETFSLWAATRHSFSDVWYGAKVLDARPPLYYWLLHLWVHAGDSESILRFLSAVFGTFTVPVVFGIGGIVGGRTAGMMAAFLLAVSPVDVHYSQEVRMYSLLPFVAAISMLATAWLLRSPSAGTAADGREISYGRPPRDLAAWTAYILATAGAMWVHYPAVFLPISTNIIVALLWPRLAHRPHFLRNWVAAQAIVVLLCLPLVPLYLYQSKGPNFPPMPPLSLAPVLEGLLPDVIMIRDSVLLFLIAVLLETALGVAAVTLAVRARGQDPQRLVFTCTLWLAPLIGEMITSALWRPVLAPKLLVWTTIPFYVLVTATLADLQARPRLRAAVLGVLLFVAVTGLSMHYWRQPEYEAWRPVARYVAQHVRPGDAILFNDGYVELPFDYYFQRYHVAAVEVGVPGSFGANSTDEPIMTQADVPALRSFAIRHKRLWLIYSHYWYTDPLRLVPKTLAEIAQLTETRAFASRESIVVSTYGPRR